MIAKFFQHFEFVIDESESFELAQSTTLRPHSQVKCSVKFRHQRNDFVHGVYIARKLAFTWKSFASGIASNPHAAHLNTNWRIKHVKHLGRFTDICTLHVHIYRVFSQMSKFGYHCWFILLHTVNLFVFLFVCFLLHCQINDGFCNTSRCK